jgi:signal transduction histidine kinase
MDVNRAREMAATLVTAATGFVAGGTDPPAPRHRWLRRGRFDLVEVADVIAALICFGATNSWLSTQNAQHHAGHAMGTLLLIAFVTSAPLALRSRFPLTAWGASALAVIGTAVVLPPRSFAPQAAYVPASLFVYLMCLYAVTVRCAPRITAAATIGTVLGAAVLDARSAAAALFLTAIPVLLGGVVRTRRSGARQLAEQERRHSGERALLEERQRIARELHDVVAHHMSVIAIQAEAAPYKAADPAPELVESFGEIRASALTGLTELRRLLGVLRTGDAATAPQPGLDGMDALLDSARSGGVSVTASVTGEPVPLPPGVDLSAYRILQEALSNAMRHAPGSRVAVRVAYRGDSLELEVCNDAGRGGEASTGSGASADGAEGADPGGVTADGAAVAGGGHGIIGMRERAAMLDGTLFAGPAEGGGFRVSAVLPVEPAGTGTEEEA